MNSIEFPQVNQHELLKVRNEIQVKLMERAAPTGDISESTKMDWIEINSQKFSRLFDSMMISDPNFLERYKGDPDSVIKSFEVALIGEPEEEHGHQIAA